jgi:hypothetical protein
VHKEKVRPLSKEGQMPEKQGLLHQQMFPPRKMQTKGSASSPRENENEK